jgi:hypothetical protein
VFTNVGIDLLKRLLIVIHQHFTRFRPSPRSSTGRASATPRLAVIHQRADRNKYPLVDDPLGAP